MLILIQLSKYLKLDQKGKIMAEYVWVDAVGETRSKSRVSDHPLSRASKHTKSRPRSKQRSQHSSLFAVGTPNSPVAARGSGLV